MRFSIAEEAATSLTLTSYRVLPITYHLLQSACLPNGECQLARPSSRLFSCARLILVVVVVVASVSFCLPPWKNSQEALDVPSTGTWGNLAKLPARPGYPSSRPSSPLGTRYGCTYSIIPNFQSQKNPLSGVPRAQTTVAVNRTNSRSENAAKPKSKNALEKA
jgi:hypothetical protein